MWDEAHQSSKELDRLSKKVDRLEEAVDLLLGDKDNQGRYILFPGNTFILTASVATKAESSGNQDDGILHAQGWQFKCLSLRVH